MPNAFDNAGSRICRIRVVLPDPLTPVTTVMQCKGICTSTLCRLCIRAPLRMILLEEVFLRLGVGTFLIPVRYCCVRLGWPFSLFLIKSVYGPAYTISPPC